MPSLAAYSEHMHTHNEFYILRCIDIICGITVKYVGIGSGCIILPHIELRTTNSCVGLQVIKVPQICGTYITG